MVMATTTAVAQQMPQQPAQPEVQALSGQLIEQMQQTLQWRTRAIQDEQKIADLQAQLEKLQKK
jgi:hypothetical protein